MQVTTASEQLNRSEEGAGPILSTCFSTQTVPCMVSGVTNSTKDHLQPQRLRIGSLKRRLSVPGDGKSSSSCSLIPMGFCTGSQVASCTGGLPQHTAWTTGLDPLHWREQVTGASSNPSSSIPKGFCTASKMADFHKRHPPVDVYDNWLATSTLIGPAEWSHFQQLFFMADGQLYGVHNGKFYKRSPPAYHLDNWLGSANLIGSGGWSMFKFLMAPLKLRTVVM